MDVNSRMGMFRSMEVRKCRSTEADVPMPMQMCRCQCADDNACNMDVPVDAFVMWMWIWMRMWMWMCGLLIDFDAKRFNAAAAVFQGKFSCGMKHCV
jgi:hypothetical protein